ncbi:hypothetical protein SASPL_141941 [Salvia splendens]|uniref:Probable purine permease n=1 Tax=Salvia splendens TaxID=180675 RepID=A0A8X8WIZ3_SALSN|nr:hypothetical protein SASPL_141941 [Salvia splendens]
MEEAQTTATMKRVYLIINCLILAVGNCGGPLIMRLYFVRGGNRIWFSSWLETGGWPIILLPLLVSYTRRRKTGSAKLVLMGPRVFVAAAAIGTATGLDDYMYAYGVARLPVSTSSLIIATQLAFTAAFAFVLVKQRFTAYSVNAVVLLTLGAVVLGLHTEGDRPEGESNREYLLGFFLTLIAAALYGLILPLVELMYKRAKQALTYTLVMEIQLVLCFFATLFCTVGMIVNNDFQAISREAKEFELGETRYYVVVVCSAIIWQCFFLGAIGVIYYSSSLLSGIVVTVLLPITEILAVIFYHERFQAEKGRKKEKKNKQSHQMEEHQTNSTAAMKRVYLIINCLILAVGSCSGPLLMRLYFLRGGKRVCRKTGNRTLVLIRPRVLFTASAVGSETGLDDYMYSYGVSRLPVSTSPLAFVLVRQRFTAYTVNAAALLTLGAVVLGLHTDGDRPEGEYYLLGFFLTLIAAALYGLILPLVELMYKRAMQPLTYNLALEIQLVICFFATAFCTVGMIVNKRFPGNPKRSERIPTGRDEILRCCGLHRRSFPILFLGCNRSCLLLIVVVIRHRHHCFSSNL